MSKINVSAILKRKISYPIIIEEGLLKQIPEILKEKNWGKRYAIITDTNVRKLYGAKLKKALERKKIDCELFSIPRGEKYKRLTFIEDLANQISKKGFHRDDCLIALGGGVIGDMTGFLASIYMRGMHYIHIPTTLLAMCDASIGGKTGVDTEVGKNMIGTFYQPKAVMIDPHVLKTLSSTYFIEGLAEVIKHAVINDKGLFKLLNKKYEQVLALDEEILYTVIYRSVKVKAQIVKEDTEEKSRERMKLNYGHTIGHAIEKLTKFTMHHGHAVAIGMRIVNQLARDRRMLNEKNQIMIDTLLEKVGLPIMLPQSISPKEIVKMLRYDKKVRDNKIHFVLPTKIGNTVIVSTVKDQEIIRACR